MKTIKTKVAEWFGAVLGRAKRTSPFRFWAVVVLFWVVGDTTCGLGEWLEINRKYRRGCSNWFTRFCSRFYFTDGICFRYGHDDYLGETWKVLKIGGQIPEIPTGYCCSYDCCGHSFIRGVNAYLFGLVTVTRWAVNV